MTAASTHVTKKRPRRIWQFSLRTFLVVSLVASLVLTWIARQYVLDVPPPPDPQAQVVPTDWHIGSFERKTGKWLNQDARNVRWVAELGSQNYGPPVVSDGKIFIGTNNGAGYIQRFPASVDLGVLLCFRQSDGQFLWQHSNQKLATGRVQDWPLQGVCSKPLVEGERLWYVTNRCEVVCLDTQGFYDEVNDGPYRNEAVRGLREADVIWKLDMIGKLGVSPHNMSNCNVLSAGHRLFVCTSNGLDESHINLPKPSAPSFICLDKNTGKRLWSDNSPGKNILHGQWGLPAYGVLGGVPQIIFPGGDGWIYSFDPAGGAGGKSKLLWKFDCNPKTSQWILGGRGTRNNVIAAPLLYKDRVYAVVGQDPEHGEGNGHLWCIDPTKRGDVSPELIFNKSDPTMPIEHKRIQACVAADGDFTRNNPNSAVIWHYSGSQTDLNNDGKIDFEEEFHRTIASVAIKDGLLFATDFSGLLHCLDADTGKPYWTYDLLAACWTGPKIFGDHVYVFDEDGDVAIFRVSADPTVAMTLGQPIREIYMENSIYSSPTAADNILYIANKNRLFAIEQGAKPVGK